MMISFQEEPFRLNPSRYTKDSARGKVASGHVVRSAHMAAPTDAGSEAPEMGSSFHQFLSEANMVAVILPVSFKLTIIPKTTGSRLRNLHGFLEARYDVTGLKKP